MKRKSILFTILAFLLALTVFAACNRNPEETDDNGEQQTTPPVEQGNDYNGDSNDVDPVTFAPGTAGYALAQLDVLLQRFPMAVDNNAPILQRGDSGNILRMVVGSPNSFPGLFNSILSSEAFDSTIMDFQLSPMVTVDENFMWSDDGIATLRFEFQENGNSVVVLSMRPGVNPLWHDGTPLTLDDLVFGLELMAHPEEQQGVRFVAAHYVTWIVGMDEFREANLGEQTIVGSIEGLVLSNNNRTLRIYYDRPLPPAAQYAGGIWTTPTPRHHIEPAIAEVGISELSTHARARHEAIGFGPWIIDSIVPGESVLFRANDDYWRGAPLLDGMSWTIMPNETYMAAMRAGEFDVTIQGMPNADFGEHLVFNPTNYTIIAQTQTGTGFMYFRTGTFDFDENQVVPRPEGWHPIQDVNVRRALSHAMPQQLMADTIQNGLSIPAGTVMAPHNARAFIDPHASAIHFDIDLANNILDEAGYRERGADGYRLDLNGNPMVFNFAANDNSFNQDAVPTYLDHWRMIGLNVQLYTGDLIDWNTFLTNLLLNDHWSDNVHMFISNWTLGMNPAPHGLWGVDNSFNMSRHRSAEMEEILDRIGSQQAFDFDFLTQAYVDWQRYMFENVPANHMFWGVGVTAVNNRVANFSLERFSGHVFTNERSIHWALTASVPY
jgi:peptide/nickel transport system substrate-binding protein